jgi:predicted transcriptional regulator
MSDSATLTVRLPRRAKEQLDALARDTRRSRNRLAAEAIETYLAANAWQVEAVREAITAADAGVPYYAHEDVMAYLERRAKEGPRTPQPKPAFLSRRARQGRN